MMAACVIVPKTWHLHPLVAFKLLFKYWDVIASIWNEKKTTTAI